MCCHMTGNMTGPPVVKHYLVCDGLLSGRREAEAEALSALRFFMAFSFAIRDSLAARLLSFAR